MGDSAFQTELFRYRVAKSDESNTLKEKFEI